ncbi:MAG: DUF4178 domain-containing protein [Pyrinomonadaceae bacterium]|nr:DUF4178 domain-containing protein [Pyrinomonadaceae bacterium]
MSVLKANCPSCAGPIEFKSGSTIVIVCPFCRSAVARTDRKLEDLGKVAEIVQSKSPLKIGLKGEYKGKRFELTGRAQIKHGAGGFWDEWYATFNNGWTGWLAEAQGRFYMTFYRPIPEGVPVPGFEELKPGQKITSIVEGTPLVVQEKGTASYIAAEGEIPYQLEPEEKSNYIDLAGKNNVFATIDYGTTPPFLFFGEKVSLEDVGLATKKSAERAAPRVAAEAMGCPKCGGTLELKAPDKTERVTCPYCESLLDVNEGNLKFLRAMKPSPSPVGFAIEVGAKCKFEEFADGEELEVIGAMTRSVTFDGIKYFWNEYLLYNPKVGFKWLVQSDDHWSFVESVNTADVEVTELFSGAKPTVKFKGKTFKIFQDTPARVEYVKGEFYWRVEVGDSVRAADFVAPPLMLSQELTKDEVNWSIGTYVPKKRIEKVFDIDWLPGPTNVAPNQPFPSGGLIKWSFLLLGAFVLTAIFLLPLTGVVSTPLNQEFVLDRLSSPTTSRVVFSQKFKLKGNSNVSITGLAPVRNSWTELSVDLVNEKNNEIEAVTIPIEYYYGVTDGESWSEGGNSNDATISAVPAGEYRLRIEGVWKDWQKPMPIRVKVQQNVSRGVNFCVAFVLLALVPILTLFRKFSFESRRWSESMFGSS